MQPFLKQQFKHRLMVVFSRSQWLYTVVLVDNDMAILGQLKVDLLEMKNDSHVLINTRTTRDHSNQSWPGNNPTLNCVRCSLLWYGKGKHPFSGTVNITRKAYRPANSTGVNLYTS